MGRLTDEQITQGLELQADSDAAWIAYRKKKTVETSRLINATADIFDDYARLHFTAALTEIRARRAAEARNDAGELARLRTALEFYAADETWAECGFYRTPDAVWGDAGERAREALAAAPATPPVGPGLEWRFVTEGEWRADLLQFQLTLRHTRESAWWLSCTGGVIAGPMSADLEASKSAAEVKLRAFFTAGLTALSGATGEQ